MNLRSLRRHWDAYGRQDPFWAILTQPDKVQGRWNADEFFRTGRDEIASVMSYISMLGLTVGTNRALDFGCGVGRLTQALASHFDEVVGIDIAPSMIELARAHDRTGHCRFVLNDTDSLPGIESGTFDFVYSNIVLQHMEPRFTRRYLAEFLRVLRPGGLLLFQLPAALVPVWPPVARRGYKALVPEPVLAICRRLRLSVEFPRMEGHSLPRSEVVALLTSAGGDVLDVGDDESAGPQWRSYRYCVRRLGAECKPRSF
jgi:SAM-dependent methyltransferase